MEIKIFLYEWLIAKKKQKHQQNQIMHRNYKKGVSSVGKKYNYYVLCYCYGIAVECNQ